MKRVRWLRANLFVVHEKKLPLMYSKILSLYTRARYSHCVKYPRTWNFLDIRFLVIGRKKLSLHNKCPYLEVFLVRTFPYSDWIQRFTLYICVFSLIVGQHGPEKNPNLNTSHAVTNQKNPLFLRKLRNVYWTIFW